MLSTLTAPFLPPGTGGGFRTWRSASWTHMVPTHKTTVVLSNVPELVSFQRATGTTAACVQHISSTPLGPAFFSSSLLPFLETSCAPERTELSQLRKGGRGGLSPPHHPTQSNAHILDHISGSYLFCGPGGEGRGGVCGGSSPAHQLLLDRPTMVALH